VDDLIIFHMAFVKDLLRPFAFGAQTWWASR